MKSKSYTNVKANQQQISQNKIDSSICNFFPKVLRRIEVKGSGGTIVYAAVKLLYEDGESKELIVPMHNLDKVDWYVLEPRCIINPRDRSAGRCVENLIRKQLGQVPSETQYRIDYSGINCIDGVTFFVAGDRIIIGSSNNEAIPKLNLDNIKFRLDTDSELTASESFKGMKELISLSPEIGRILVAHAISGIIRTAFKNAGFIPCTVLMIVGRSGLLKSHYVPHLVQLYNRSDEIKAATRFNSSQSFIEKTLSEYSECTAVIDDLHSAASKGIKNRNENTAEEMIRRISDNTGRGHKEGNTLVQEKFKGNVVFIGEYVFGQESTIPRALIVELTKRPNGIVLDKYQRKQPLLVSTFYKFFIQWYVEHFNVICDEIDMRLTKFRETMIHSSIHGRLCDVQFYLQISYMVFLEFCKESDFISEEDSLSEYNNFCSQISKLVQGQQEKFRSDGEEEAVDYLKLIRKLYKQGKFCVAKKRKEFDLEKHDGIICYECLCLRRESLEREIRDINTSFNVDDCVRNLLAMDALKRGEQKNTVQIYGIGGRRFYALKLDKLD